MKNEKDHQKDFYNQISSIKISELSEKTKLQIGSSSKPEYLKEPYFQYEKAHTQFINSNSIVLEIGSSTGLHSYSLVQTGAKIYTTDISINTAIYIKKKYRNYKNIRVQLADMEKLPFRDMSFDIVCSEGSLSYGDNHIVMNEIHRVLKTNGIFISLDSLNNNPIYKFNRWIHYLNGTRTINNLNRMPNLDLIKSYESKFGFIEVRFFGSISWLSPFLSKLIGNKLTTNFSNYFDKLINTKKSAFKFLLIAKKSL